MEEQALTNEVYNQIECMLFVAGDPVAITELARVLDCPLSFARTTLRQMEEHYQQEGRGIQLLVTDDTVQLISNRAYFDSVKTLLNPDETKSVSQSLLETLAVIAYRQPTTKGVIEQVRGVKCDYSVQSLLNKGLIKEVGRKEALGRPILYATTDLFLEHFGITDVRELPPLPQITGEQAEPQEPLVP